MTTPIPRILLAFEGLVDWTKATNPFGTDDEAETPSETGIAGMRVVDDNTVDLSRWQRPDNPSAKIARVLDGKVKQQKG